MNVKTLESLCNVVSGGTPSRSNPEFWNDGTIPWIKIGNIKSKYVSEADEYITQKGLDESSAKLLSKGTILYTIFATLGETGILTIDACTNQAIAGITIKDSKIIDTDYLYYYLKSKKKYVNNLGRGVAQNNINMSILRKFEIPVPSIEQQKNIVANLDKVNRIIELRLQELQKLDALIKARFVEMFGNPLAGTAKYPVHQVGEVAESVDPQPSHRTPPVEENGIPYVSIKDCDYKTGKIDFRGARKVSRKVLEEHLNRYTLHEGDFVIGKIGTIGNPVFVPARDDYALSANVVLVQPNVELVSPYFLKCSFESHFVERQFAEAKNSTSQAAFGIQKVRTLEVMNPDIEVQRNFEIFVKQVDKSKAAVQKSLDETQLLFDSLMQEYFG
jgi:type I restriction enzyme S subunit